MIYMKNRPIGAIWLVEKREVAWHKKIFNLASTNVMPKAEGFFANKEATPAGLAPFANGKIILYTIPKDAPLTIYLLAEKLHATTHMKMRRDDEES